MILSEKCGEEYGKFMHFARHLSSLLMAQSTFTTLTFTRSHTHSYKDGGGRHAGGRPLIRSDLGFGLSLEDTSTCSASWAAAATITRKNFSKRDKTHFSYILLYLKHPPRPHSYQWSLDYIQAFKRNDNHFCKHLFFLFRNYIWIQACFVPETFSGSRFSEFLYLSVPLSRIYNLFLAPPVWVVYLWFGWAVIIWNLKCKVLSVACRSLNKQDCSM